MCVVISHTLFFYMDVMFRNKVIEFNLIELDYHTVTIKSQLTHVSFVRLREVCIYYVRKLYTR